MSNPRQLALQIQINERASLNNFFVSKKNNKTIQILKNILLGSDKGVQIFLDDLGSNGKSYLLQAICNDFSNSNNSSIYIPMQEAINLDPSILEGVSELNLICIDDIDLINKRREWEIALFNLINECYEKECFLLLSGSINKLEAIPDLVSRIKKMETLRLEAINDDELLEATKAISKNLNMEISDKNMNYLINNSKRDIKTIFRTLSQLEKESLERKKSIGLNLIKEVIQNS
jgi:DnaA family protein